MFFETGQLDVGLGLCGLGLLEADHVGIEFLDAGIKQSLLRHGPNSIDVPGD
jgi:hypothetical protein